MSKAQTDIRTTSYDAATANAVGYQGSLDDALAQIRAQMPDQPQPRARAVGSERRELLRFLGVRMRTRPYSGIEEHSLTPYLNRANLFQVPEDDSVTYYTGKGDTVGESPYSLEYAIKRGWVTRVQS